MMIGITSIWEKENGGLIAELLIFKKKRGVQMEGELTFRSN